MAATRVTTSGGVSCGIVSGGFPCGIVSGGVTQGIVSGGEITGAEATGTITGALYTGGTNSGAPGYGDVSLGWGVMIQEKKKKADAMQIHAKE
jgi:hypothetical protein